MLARRLAELSGHDLGAAELELAIDRRLDDAIAEARSRWPALDGARHDVPFVAAIAARVEGEADLAEALARLALADLYLVAACLHGDRAALAAVERLVRDETVRAVARLDRGGIGAEDVVQELLVKLVVAGHGERPKLAAFGGHGALQAWLRVAAMRTAISVGRRRHEQLVEDEALAQIADDGEDQALAFLKSSYRPEFKRAFEAAFAELPRRSRTLLRLQIIDHLTIEDIGDFYQVSRATVGRWLAEARSGLVEATQQRIVASLQLAPEEVSELMRLVASSLYSTLPRLLRATAAER